MWSVIFLIAFHFPSCIAFQNKCPSSSERDFRATALCNTSSALNYSCLFDENRAFNVESCITKTDFAPPGYQYVLRGQPDFTQCEIERYQPIRLWSNVSNQCIFEKSKCIENGQFLFKNGTTETDRSCRCDYTRGYAFITKPKNQCFCIPSEEECSCYKKYCPHKGLLTPDYNCATEKDKPGQNTYLCPIIVYNRLLTDSYTIKEKNNFVKELGAEFSSRMIVFVLTAICTFLIAVQGILVLVCVKGQELSTSGHSSRCKRELIPPLTYRDNGVTQQSTVTSTTSAEIDQKDNEYRREREFTEDCTLITAEEYEGTTINESEYSIPQYADDTPDRFCGSTKSLDASTSSEESYTDSVKIVAIPNEINICSNGDQQKQCDDLSVVALGRTENVEIYEPVEYHEYRNCQSKQWFIAGQ